MNKPHRIAAGGLVFKEQAVLLVRYRQPNGGTFLVGPGGGLEQEENIPQAIVREVQEETGVTVAPKRLVLIEDLLTSRFKMIKVWMVCDFVAGDIYPTQAAKEEGILEADWFTRDQLVGKVVYPALLLQYNWEQIRSETWRVECLPSRKATF